MNREAIVRASLLTTLDHFTPPSGTKHQQGKVRESLILEDGKRIIITSDRISAFDFVLGTIPFKGAVLNQIAAWWFEKLKAIIPHHLISVPDPQISLTKSAKVLPVEFVVRGHLTGSTATSSWYAYQHHDRVICGIEMPAGMAKNQAFEAPLITPTTKPALGSGEHDKPISREEIISNGLVDEKTYALAEEYALKMFTAGQRIAAERGLILVDTKYEMGIDADGKLIVVDEVHTPDSSRYWVADSYASRFASSKEPDMLDKEFVRRGLVANGINIHADPETYDGSAFLTDELRVSASLKYMDLYERITGDAFEIPYETDANGRVAAAVQSLLA